MARRDGSEGSELRSAPRSGVVPVDERGARKWFWIELAVVVVVVIGLAVWLVRAEMAPLQADDLQTSVSELRSEAAEAALLADAAGAGRLPETFTREHSGWLADEVASTADSLEKAKAAPGVGERLARARVLAAEVRGCVASVPSALSDSEHAGSVRATAERLADEAETLERLLDQ